MTVPYEAVSGWQPRALERYARQTATDLLRDIPDRLRRSEAVAAAAARLVPPGAERTLAKVAGLLHDVGAAVPETGHRGLDGAHYLARTPLAPLVPFVAWYATAAWEAKRAGLVIDFPWPKDGTLVWGAGWVGAMTVDEQGLPADPLTRMESIWGPGAEMRPCGPLAVTFEEALWDARDGLARPERLDEAPAQGAGKGPAETSRVPL